MKSFDCFQPTEIRFGPGRIREVGEVVARFGKRCLLVTRPETEASGSVLADVKKGLEEAGVSARALRRCDTQSNDRLYHRGGGRSGGTRGRRHTRAGWRFEHGCGQSHCRRSDS